MFRGLIFNPLFRKTSVQGGSTITQQLVKNTLLTPERTITRKIKEIILAIRLEKKYSKDQIFEFYLNQIPYGSNAYGIESASRTFFNKSVSGLNLAEAATLASLPKAPSYLSPYGNHTDKLKQRQEYILDRMAELNWISQQEAGNAKNTKLEFSKQRFPIKAPHFVFYVRALLEEMYEPQLIETGGLNVYTTLDWKLQQIAEKAVLDGALRNDKTWQADNAALLAQNPKTGEILAMVGSRDYFNLEKQGNLNITLSTRQPGSAFKPFVYLKAFEKGYPTETILFDAFTEFDTSCGPDPSQNPDTCYHPRNYDNQFRGPVSLRRALAQSLNVPSVKLLYLVGIRDAIQTTQSLGITTFTEDPDYYGLSLILGGGGVKLIDMVQAYSVFANDGFWHKQTAILRIADSQGNVLYENKPEEKQVFNSKYIRVLNNVLSDDPARAPTFQPNGPLTVPGYQVAAKTGTSQDYRDAWTIGYSPTLVTGIWVGNNDYSPMRKEAAGGMAAAPIWNDFMKQVLTHFEKENFPDPEFLPASKPILAGQYIVDGQIHNILYWLDKNNPQGPAPINPLTDPQFNHWEYGVLAWLAQHSEILGQESGFNALITLLEPKENTLMKPNQSLKISFRINSSIKISRAEFYFNQKPVIVFEGNEQNLYSVFFVPSEVKQTNQLLIKAFDIQGKSFELLKEFKSSSPNN
jgi:penicillin-binding protein 1C